jgi:Domain of unknown function (DUF4926)
MSKFPKSELARQVLDIFSDKHNSASIIQWDSDFWRNPKTGFPECVESAWRDSILRSSMVFNAQDIVMEQHKTNTINELDVVALLADAPEANLSRGQVGTVVHSLDKDTVLVEFCDNDGAAYAITPLSKKILLPLVYESRAA